MHGCAKSWGAISLAIILIACTVQGDKGESPQHIKDRIKKLSEKYDCRGAVDTTTAKHVLIWIPNTTRDDQVTVVTPDKAAQLMGPGKYQAINWCSQ